MAVVTRFVALLRGVNVGGRNVITMADLRAAFVAGGFADVGTYIQSGNVLFGSDAPAAGLEERIEALLRERFGVPLVTVVRSLGELGAVVADAPPGFGERPDRHHSDVIFLRPPLTSRAAMEDWRRHRPVGCQRLRQRYRAVPGL